MVEKFLLEGKQNAIKSQKLADLTGCKSIRELQEVIAAERAAGAVILSTCQNGGGYFLPIPGDRKDMPYLFVKSWLPNTKINRTGTRSADDSANHVFFISFHLVQYCTSKK